MRGTSLASTHAPKDETFFFLRKILFGNTLNSYHSARGKHELRKSSLLLVVCDSQPNVSAFESEPAHGMIFHEL